MSQQREQAEELSSEVVMLCSLLARIIYRSLKERNARLMALLSEPTDDRLGEQGTEVSESPSDRLA